MTPWLRLLPLVAVLLLSMGLGLGLFTSGDSKKGTMPMIGLQVAHFEVPSLDSKDPPFSPSRWKGRVSLLNIFASWCESCAAEHAALMEFTRRHSVAIYGIAWRDKPEAAIAWLNKRGNPYQAIGVDTFGRATISLGLTGVPETFVIDANNTVLYQHKGPVSMHDLETVVLPLIQRHKQPAAP